MTLRWNSDNGYHKSAWQECSIAPTQFTICLEGNSSWRRKIVQPTLYRRLGNITEYEIHIQCYMLKDIDEQYTIWSLTIDPTKTW